MVNIPCYVILSGTQWSRNISNVLRFLHFGRKERSDGIASKQVCLVRASMTKQYVILSVVFCHLDRSGEV
ncbi:MAG: hypothetical protein OSJ74_08260 [Clostridia bacterium]|nr:hypothetical protein [Clostridia bacterium]